MAIESKIYDALKASDTLIAVTTAIYPDRIPQQTTLPTVTYSRVSGVRLWTLSGYTSVENCRVQFDIYSTSVLQRRTLCDLVINALASSTTFNTVADNSPRDEYDDQTGVFSRSIDVSIWNRE
jgi:hypothetical protein